MPNIQRYISNELTHFVGHGEIPEKQFSLLVYILRSGWLTHLPHKPEISGNLEIKTTAKISENEMYLPQVVCFCDIPNEDLHIHTTKYSQFGFSLSRDFVAQKGGAPVFYVPLNTSVQWPRHFSHNEPPRALSNDGIDDLYEEVHLGALFDRMVPEYLRFILQSIATQLDPIERFRLLEIMQFLSYRFLSYVKSFDNKLPDNDPKNFYMEREWRVVGNIQFSLEDVKRICIPQAFGKRLRDDIPDFYGQVTFID